MQLLKTNLDGSNRQISEMQAQETRQAYVDATVAASAESPGYLCVCGESLDAVEATERVYNVIAISGAEASQNMVGSGKQSAASASKRKR